MYLEFVGEIGGGEGGGAGFSFWHITVSVGGRKGRQGQG